MTARSGTYYALLGVPPSASMTDIRRAFRRMARTYHPDMRGGHHDPRYLAVAEAYAVLSDPARRAAYDAELASARRRGPAGGRRPSGGRATARTTFTPEPPPPAEPPWPYPEEPLPAPVGKARIVGPGWWQPQGGAVPVRQARTQRVWGTPGGGLAAAPGAGSLRVSAEVCRNTARVVAGELGDIPGLRVFHAVRLPTGEILDHVLVCGGRIAVATSRETPSPVLRWERGRITGAAGTGPSPLTLDGVRWLSAHLEDEDVAGWVLVYATPGAATQVSNAGAPPYLRLQTAGRGVGEIRNWLLTDNDARVVDRVLLHRLAGLVVE